MKQECTLIKLDITMMRLIQHIFTQIFDFYFYLLVATKNYLFLNFRNFQHSTFVDIHLRLGAGSKKSLYLT